MGKFVITVPEPVSGDSYHIWVGNAGASSDELADIADENGFMNAVRHVDFAIAAGADLEFTVDMSETTDYGKYAIRLIRAGLDGVENAYLSYLYLDATLTQRAIEAFMAVKTNAEFEDAVKNYSTEPDLFIAQKDLGILADGDILASVGEDFALVRDYKYLPDGAFEAPGDVVACAEAAYALRAYLDGDEDEAAEAIEKYGSFTKELFPEKEDTAKAKRLLSPVKELIVDAESLGEVLSVVSEYSALLDDGGIDVFEKNKDGIKNADELEEVLTWSKLLGKLNGANRSEIEKIITENSDFLGVDTSSAAHNGVSLARVAQRFDTSRTASLYGKDAFSDYYDSIAQAIADENGGKGSSKGSGKVTNSGGGGISSKGIHLEPPKETEADVAPSQAQKDSSGLPFKDIDGCAWAHGYIRALYDKNIIKGVTEDSFEPDRPVTREEFVKMLVVAFEIATDRKMIFDFTDVTVDIWSYPYIEAAYCGGIVRGKTADCFGRLETITRQDAAVMIARVIGAESGDKPAFTDADAISDYALPAVAGVSARGIIAGYADGSFGPMDVTTRAQAATIIARAIEGGNAE